MPKCIIMYRDAKKKIIAAEIRGGGKQSLYQVRNKSVQGSMGHRNLLPTSFARVFKNTPIFHFAENLRNLVLLLCSME